MYGSSVASPTLATTTTAAITPTDAAAITPTDAAAITPTDAAASTTKYTVPPTYRVDAAITPTDAAASTTKCRVLPTYTVQADAKLQTDHEFEYPEEKTPKKKYFRNTITPEPAKSTVPSEPAKSAVPSEPAKSAVPSEPAKSAAPSKSTSASKNLSPKGTIPKLPYVKGAFAEIGGFIKGEIIMYAINYLVDKALPIEQIME